MTKYSPEIIDEITRYIAQGLSQKDAAQMAGVAETTFYRWLDEKKEFRESLSAVELDFKKSLIQKLVFARNYNAWKFLLERKFPDEFGLTQKMELSGNDGGPITLDATEKLVTRIAAISKRRTETKGSK